MPELNDAVARVLTPSHRPGNRKTMGILLEPAHDAWSTNWHRDWTHHVGELVTDWTALRRDMDLFNQVNCALYEDGSTWVVPGSHQREDTAAETARFPRAPTPNPDLFEESPVERERSCRQYCESMPGAVQLQLHAGDYALNRSIMWHIGSYLPYWKRATIHDAADTAEFEAWRQDMDEKNWREVAQRELARAN